MLYELPEVEARAKLLAEVYDEYEKLKKVNKYLNMHYNNTGHTWFKVTMTYYDPEDGDFKTILVPMNPDLDTDIRVNISKRAESCKEALLNYFNAAGGYFNTEEDEA
jgi:hypothetical protein